MKLIDLFPLRRVYKSPQLQPIRISRFRRLELDTQHQWARSDDASWDAKLGCWTFYLPQIHAKLLHARHGCIDCTHASRPTEKMLQQSGLSLGRYQSDDWRKTLSTPITRRLAELWIITARLWQAGLGPQPFGICFVEQFERDGKALGPTCGLFVENVLQLPRKRRTQLEVIQAAGVIPDKILSCFRQQMRGYVIDLCSVIGCQPIDAEPDISRLEALLTDHTPDDTLNQALQETRGSLYSADHGNTK